MLKTPTASRLAIIHKQEHLHEHDKTPGYFRMRACISMHNNFTNEVQIQKKFIPSLRLNMVSTFRRRDISNLSSSLDFTKVQDYQCLSMYVVLYTRNHIIKLTTKYSARTRLHSPECQTSPLIFKSCSTKPPSFS